ncbi:MAG: DUF2029 domain-containing protein [Bacteroidetes bacterium]|nr:DUF2029 domain-containing protein [Bacteroidota bacterium]
MQLKLITVIAVSVFIAVLAIMIYRDIGVTKQNPRDLRNRVVGARLIKDGKSPYFYKWKTGDGMRYYDSVDFNNLKVSLVITASPFYLQCFSAMAEWPESRIAQYWLWIEYILFVIIVSIALVTADSTKSRYLVLIIGIAFLLTEAWKVHVFVGQNYLVIPFLAMLFYFAVEKSKGMAAAFLAGLLAISLVMIRPNTILFFLPFLFLVKRFNIKYWLFFFAPIVMILLFEFGTSKERDLWKDYRANIVEHARITLGLPLAQQKNDPSPNYVEWEGINQADVTKERGNNPIRIYSEHANPTLIVDKLFHYKLSATQLLLFSVIALLALANVFYKSMAVGRDKLALHELAIAGFCLYMLTDLSSPVLREQYYSMQWIFPVMLSVAYSRSYKQWPYFFIMLGLLLNCLNLGFIKMEHTIGEYLMFFGLIALVLTRKKYFSNRNGKIET